MQENHGTHTRINRKYSKIGEKEVNLTRQEQCHLQKVKLRPRLLPNLDLYQEEEVNKIEMTVHHQIVETETRFPQELRIMAQRDRYKLNKN